MNYFLLVTFLFVYRFAQPLYAVQTASQKDEDYALKEGKRAKNVCHVGLATKQDKKSSPTYLSSGTGVLIEPTIVATAGHVIVDGLENEPNGELKKVLKKLKKGKVVSLLGYVTFSPDILKTFSKYERLKTEDYLRNNFYEIDSIIVHPNYDYSDPDAKRDLAFIKLKTPVRGIRPLSLYQEGLLPLELYRENDLNTEIIHAYFSGYGADFSQRSGKRRTVSQLCFLEDGDLEDVDSQKHGCWRFLTSHSEQVVSITGVVPSKRRSTGIKVEKKRDKFHDTLYKEKRKGEVYGLIFRGDSGGPLTVKTDDGKEFLIGLESTQGWLPKSTDLPSHGKIKGFHDVQNAKRAFESYFFPLFTLSGQLRPEIPKMLKKLKDSATLPSLSSEDLGDIVLTERNLFIFHDAYLTFMETLDAALTDMRKLLKLKFSQKESTLKKFKKIQKKYQCSPLLTYPDFARGEKLEKLPIDLEKAKKLLKKSNKEAFKLEIKGKIEKLEESIKSLDLGV